jgi:hypothetical protein
MIRKNLQQAHQHKAMNKRVQHFLLSTTTLSVFGFEHGKCERQSGFGMTAGRAWLREI